MNWREVPLTEHMTEAARIVGEAEMVIEFTATARGWFRVTVFEDLKGAGEDARFFARATEKEDPQIQAIATAASPEEAASLCLKEAGISLRRARSK